MSYQHKTERAQAQIRGEVLQPEAEELERVVVLERNVLVCSWCGSSRLVLVAAAGLPNVAEPDVLAIWIDCADCRVRALVELEDTPGGIAVSVEQAL